MKNVDLNIKDPVEGYLKTVQKNTEQDMFTGDIQLNINPLKYDDVSMTETLSGGGGIETNKAFNTFHAQFGETIPSNKDVTIILGKTKYVGDKLFNTQAISLPNDSYIIESYIDGSTISGRATSISSGNINMLRTIGVWSNTGSVLTARHDTVSCGASNDTLFFDGYLDGQAPTVLTERFNGTSWSNAANTTGSRYMHSGCGYAHAALNCTGYGLVGGGNQGLTSTEKFNGSSWSNSNSVIQPRQNSCCCGEQNDALMFCGDVFRADLATFNEKFNGSSWSKAPVNNILRYMAAGVGSTTNAFLIAGSGGPNRLCESFNGTTWSIIINMPTSSFELGGTGLSNSALGIGGISNEVWLRLTHRFNGFVWSSEGELITARARFGANGTSQISLAISGNISNNVSIPNTEKFTEAVIFPNIYSFHSNNSIA